MESISIHDKRDDNAHSSTFGREHAINNFDYTLALVTNQQKIRKTRNHTVRERHVGTQDTMARVNIRDGQKDGRERRGRPTAGRPASILRPRSTPSLALQAHVSQSEFLQRRTPTRRRATAAVGKCSASDTDTYTTDEATFQRTHSDK